MYMQMLYTVYSSLLHPESINFLLDSCPYIYKHKFFAHTLFSMKQANYSSANRFLIFCEKCFNCTLNGFLYIDVFRE